jgi:hypothetical protein
MMDDIDEKNTINSYMMMPPTANSYGTNNNKDTFSKANEATSSVELGPNLNMQVNAIGHLVRRKKVSMFGKKRQQ